MLFLGAGVNLCDRPAGQVWEEGRYLPNGRELSEHLAQRYRYAGPDAGDLARVSQFVELVRGPGTLYKRLHGVFAHPYPLCSIHRHLAALPVLLMERRLPPPLIVTTNYDDCVERALEQGGVPYDLVAYVAEGEHQGKFRHCPSEGSPVIIDLPNQYGGLPLDEDANVHRTTLVKIHGTVDPKDAQSSDFVITEDDYIRYLASKDVSQLLPAQLMDKLRGSGCLFLGYGLRDWNLRVLLYRVWGEQRLPFGSWAVQREPDALEAKFWSKRDVEIRDETLDTYGSQLAAELAARGGAR